MGADLNDPFVKKLGLRPGQRVCLLPAPGDPLSAQAAAGLHAACPPGVSVDTRLEPGRYDQIFFWPNSLEGLDELFAELQGWITPQGAVWAVIPKQQYALPRGITFTWEAVQAAGLQTDLVDNKIASLNEQDYATRFVIRKDRREQYA